MSRSTGFLVAAALGLASFSPVSAWAVEDAPASVSSPSDSQGASQDVEPAQVQLDGGMVERFLNSYPELVKLSDALSSITSPSGGASEESDMPDDPIYALGNYLGDPKSSEQINAVLRRHDFASYAEWANVAHSVALAAEASEIDSGLDDLDGQKQQAIKDLEADDTLSAEEKKAAMAELEQQFASLAEFVPLPGNREAIAPYLDRIRNLGALGNAQGKTE
jgi:hypothetical protein